MADTKVSRASSRSPATAKFVSAPGWPGVFLTVDDDIVYPPCYVDLLLARAVEWPGVPVGFHGSILSASTDDYYTQDARTILRYFDDCDVDTPVDVIGTGTMAFVPEAIGFEMSWLSTRGATDLEFSAALRDRGIRPVVITHRDGWIEPVPAPLRPRSISAPSRRDDQDPLNVRKSARAIVAARFR